MSDEENIKPEDNSNPEEENSDKNIELTANDTEEENDLPPAKDEETYETEVSNVDAGELHKQVMDEAQRAQDAVRMAEEGMADQSNMGNSERENSDS